MEADRRLLCLLVATCCLATACARRAADEPAKLRYGQEEWPEDVGCPEGFVRDFRERSKSQFRPGMVICMEGNPADCEPGSSWTNKDGRYCVRCTCSNEGVADCVRLDECPPPRVRFSTHFHYNCHRNDKKVCPEGCKFLSREAKCVNCDCDHLKGSQH